MTPAEYGDNTQQSIAKSNGILQLKPGEKEKEKENRELLRNKPKIECLWNDSTPNSERYHMHDQDSV